MRKNWLIVTLILVLSLLVACGNEDDLDDLTTIDVDFDVPETAEVNETITLKATVTYDDEPLIDARQMDFERWERGKRDDGEWIEGENHGDGTYTIEMTFYRDGIFEMYAHTTAHSQHAMPKREIIVGEGGDYDDVDDSHEFHTEGFDMYFINPEDATVSTDTELIVQLMMHEEPFQNADVRYVIWNYVISDKLELVVVD